jgi:UDP-4-amino-4-deoxy-L-arabinose formyltransferase/UDP-glucuronic acid dehydrogenase (UDP-4-keto-hexauronic acid decarboxylating)
MKIAIIGRTETLYNTALLLLESGYKISLIITAKGSPEYTKNAKDFEKLASSINATFINTARIIGKEKVKVISALEKIDIGISMNYVSVISQKVIDLFRLGILNAHSGDLPRYRGNACQAWAIINGEEKIGLCVHKMVGGELDSGDIIVKDYFPININTKIGETHEWMTLRTPQMFLDALRKLEEDPSYVLEVQSKNPQDALRCYPRIPADGRINWQNPSKEILRLINASSEPYSGAFCDYNGEKVTIWDAELYEDDEVYVAASGQISQINSDGSIIVICGDGKLKVNIIEINGDRLAPSHFIKSIRKRLI